jgi:hypothetical protein
MFRDDLLIIATVHKGPPKLPADIVPDEGWIEQPKVYPHSRKVNPDDLLKLMGLVGEWKNYLESMGCRVEYVEPRQWKGTVPKHIHNRRTLSLLTDGEVAILPKRPRAKDYDHNMLDAVGLGLWKLHRPSR